MELTQEQKFKFRLRMEQEQGLVPAQPEPSLLSQIGAIASNYAGTQTGSPQQLLESVPQLLQKISGRAGQFATEQLSQGRNAVDPYTAAGVGTVISMGPDIAMAGINPMEAAPQTIPGMAMKAQRRALGFMVPELKTPFARGQAAKAAKVALERGVTSATGSPDVIFSKANELALKSGEKLGAIRESVGPQPIKPILNAIDDYKSIRLKGASGGSSDTVLNKIDNVKETIKGLSPKPVQDPIVPEKTLQKVSLKRIAEAKKEIADSVNWLSDNVSQRDAKGLAQAIEKGTEQALAQAGGDIKSYKALKPIYSAAKTMLKGLNKEIAKQEGNMAISLPALVAGASGGPLTALKIGAFELAKRRGAGIAASEIMGAANLPKTAGVPVAQAVNSLVNSKKKEPTIENVFTKETSPAKASVEPQVLTKEKAYEFVREAKGNRKKARRLAKNAGYTWEGDF